MLLIDTIIDIKSQKLSSFDFLREINKTIHKSIERLVFLDLIDKDERYNIYNTQQDNFLSTKETLAKIWYLDTINQSFRISLKAINGTKSMFTVQIMKVS